MTARCAGRVVPKARRGLFDTKRCGLFGCAAQGAPHATETAPHAAKEGALSDLHSLPAVLLPRTGLLAVEMRSGPRSLPAGFGAAGEPGMPTGRAHPADNPMLGEEVRGDVRGRLGRPSELMPGLHREDAGSGREIGENVLSTARFERHPVLKLVDIAGRDPLPGRVGGLAGLTCTFSAASRGGVVGELRPGDGKRGEAGDFSRVALAM